MHVWRSYTIHHTDLEGLIRLCVQPLLRRFDARLNRWYWERDLIAGAYLRVRLRGDPEEIEVIGPAIEHGFDQFLLAYPDGTGARDAQGRGGSVPRLAGAPLGGAAPHRPSYWERASYAGPDASYVSEEARELAIDFRHDMMAVVARVLDDPAPRLAAALRLYLVQAQVACGPDLREGLVSAKSHWENFAASYPRRDIVDRIRHAYLSNRGTVAASFDRVEQWLQRGASADEEPQLAQWQHLLVEYRVRISQLLAQGVEITPQAVSLEHARAMRDYIFSRQLRESEFVRTLWADERFLASMQHEPTFLTPRVLVNLFYIALPALGLNLFDRMTLCYFAHRAIEDRTGCDLTDYLRRNVARIAAAHSHRWAPGG